MKPFFTVFLLITMSIVVKAQKGSENKISVLSAVEKLRTAMISGNKGDLESVLSKDLVYGHSSGQIQTREDFVEGISSKKSDFVKIDLKHPSVAIVDNTAIVRHILVADINDGGKPAHIYLGIVLVWRNEKGSWKLISRNAFKVPEEN